MSRKFSFIPEIPDYKWIRTQMQEDLKYRLHDRQRRTSLGRPLYERINVQVILTQECPHRCPFCLERQNPMLGDNNFAQQQKALCNVLAEHPNARLTITGGEPGLYPEQVKVLSELYHKHSNQVFMSINTSGYNPVLQNYGHINLSVNDYVQPNLEQFEKFTYQTVLEDDQMILCTLKNIMDKKQTSEFSFRFLSSLEKHDYPVRIFQELKNDPEIQLHTFRVGDFFVYVTFDYNGNHARITLGDMYQQSSNDYQDGYSNIIIHPDGRIGVNWH